MDHTASFQIERIVFTGDLLRPAPDSRGGWESATAKSVHWLSHLLSWHVQTATGATLARVAWERGDFDAARVYESLGIPLHADGWASVYHAESLPDETEALLLAPFERSLVIGVETPEVLHGVLTRGGVPFVDLVPHPVRFMDDLLFAFRTNVPQIHAALLRRRFDLARCRPFADLLRARSAWSPGRDLPHGTALVTAQAATDPALICRRRRRFLSLSDFTERLFQVRERHPRVLFHPRPDQDRGDAERRAVETLGEIEIVTESFYDLMGVDAITDVYSISAGTTHEAPYFERRGETFAEPLHEFSDRAPEACRASACVPVGPEFMSPIFWSDLLRPVLDTRRDLPPGPPPRNDRLRWSLKIDGGRESGDPAARRARHAPARSPSAPVPTLGLVPISEPGS